MEKQKIKIQVYSKAREKILDGDILMYKGRSWYSRAIRYFTKSPYSHAGIAVWWYNRLMVMEAVGKGVVVTPLSENVSHYSGGVEWYQFHKKITDEDRLSMVHFAQQQLGKEYSYWGIAAAFLYKIFHWNIDDRDAYSRSKKLFCSYYVSEIYQHIGKDLRPRIEDRFMSPADIAHSLLLKKVAVLKKELSSD